MIDDFRQAWDEVRGRGPLYVLRFVLLDWWLVLLVSFAERHAPPGSPLWWLLFAAYVASYIIWP